MKNLITSLLLLIFTISLNAQTDSRLKGIDKELEKILATTNAAGFSVAVVEKDRIIYSKGFGYRDIENKKKADENTLFAIGSCTKAFTNTVLGILANDDKVDFDKSPRSYIPELNFYNDEMNNQITIKDLMSHRTGLPRHDVAWYFFPTDSKMKLLKRIEYQEPSAGIREVWQYNNFMYLTLGVLGEKITGKTWEQNVTDLIFKPLQMNRSNTTLAALKKDNNSAKPYEVKDDKIKLVDYYDISGMGPAGSIHSSANEMGNWLIALINDGKFQGEEIIPMSYLKESISSKMIIHGGLPGKERPDIHFATYGYGWMLASYKGHYRVEHGGNINGFTASTCFFPSDSIGIVVLANQNGSAANYMVRNTIMDRLLKVKADDWVKIFEEEKAKQKEAEAMEEEKAAETKTAGPKVHPFEDIVGSYTNPGYGTLDILQERDSLFVQLKRESIWLEHKQYDIFTPHLIEHGKVDPEGFMGLDFNFSSANDGTINSVAMKLEASLDPIIFKKELKTIEVAADALTEYVGDYELMGTILKVYIKGEDQLIFFVEGQPPYTLKATEKDLFAIADLDGFKVQFHRDANGKIEALSSVQPNGTFRAKRK